MIDKLNENEYNKVYNLTVEAIAYESRNQTGHGD